MRIFTVIISLTLAACSCAANAFYTSRLEKIARAVGLGMAADLPPYADTIISAGNSARPLHVRTNANGDVSHIGYRMFDGRIVEAHGSAEVFDFIERYVLELDLKLDGRPPAVRMDIDNVKLASGSIGMLRGVTPQTPFTVEEITRRVYRLRWTMAEGELCMTFPADCQLLLGAGIVELENMLERDLRRAAPGENDWKKFLKGAEISAGGNMIIVDGGKYLSELIRGDVYLTVRDGRKELYCDRRNPSRSVGNIMLTGHSATELPMRLSVVKYDGSTTLSGISVRQFVAFCRAEGCKLYFGIKKTDEARISGTLFALNERLAYNHVLSVDFPLGILSGEPGEVKAVVYPYIPLQNVTEKFFIQDIK